ncbi:MAG TPA: hypothetical protein G4O18_03250 [Dehalococcoidia bacterium]|nr:hypothetical protein [Dehalococcoidia bacterium]
MAEMKELAEQLDELRPSLSEVGNPPHTFAVELAEQENETSVRIRYDIYLNAEGAQELIDRVRLKRNNESLEVQKLRDWFAQLKQEREEDELYNQILDGIELHVEELDKGFIDEDDEDDFGW